jgi:sigma-B regulation protein RsbQ
MSALTRNNVKVRGRAGAPAIVFAHGFGCDQNMWRYVWPAFQADYQVVLFDHVGNGESDLQAYEPDKYASLDGYATDVLEIIEALELIDVVFVGHSVSAMIGLLAANRQPELFSRLVLVGPSARYIDDPASGYVGGFSEQDIDELLTSLESNYLGWSSAMAPVIMGNAERPELGAELTDSFCRSDPQIARRFAQVTFRSDNRPDLAGTTTPTLILQCSEDVIAPLAVGQYLNDQIAGSELRILRATGHCPNLSAPEETTAAISEFLKAPLVSGA